MPVGQRASLGVGGEVGLQPLPLRGIELGGNRGGTGVQHDDVPGTELVAVVALRRIAGHFSEIVEIRLRSSGIVLVVAEGREGAGAMAAPARLVTPGEVVGASGRIGVIAERHHGARNAVE